MELKGKRALVTGSSRGIGAATAIALAKEECAVVVHCKSDAAAAKAVVAECGRYSKGHVLVQADLSSQKAVEALLEEVRSSFGHLDVLVNNAGIFDEEDSPTNAEAFERIYRNNFLSCVLVTKCALPLMRSGKIVNISSVHAQLGHGRPEAIAYSAFKAALESYTKNLAKALAPSILVNAVAPGRVATSMWGELNETERTELGSAHLINRMIEPEEVADALLFLCKNDALCGEVLTIDGGMSLVTLG